MEPLSQVEFVRRQLERRRGQWKRVSEESGVAYTTIKNLMQRPESYPRVPTLNKLYEYLQHGEQKREARP